MGLLACVLFIPGAYSIDVSLSVDSGGESASLESSYDVDTDVAVSEESQASANQPEIENSRSVAGSGDIKTGQSYSGSGGHRGSANFASTGSGSLVSSASLSSNSMNALQSVSATGTADAGMAVANGGTASVNCNLISGSMAAEQGISTGSAHASQGVQGSGILGASVSGKDNSQTVIQSAYIIDGSLSTGQGSTINNALTASQQTQLDGDFGSVYGDALGQENCMVVTGQGPIQEPFKADLQSSAVNRGIVRGSVSNGGYEGISDDTLRKIASMDGVMSGMSFISPQGDGFNARILNVPSNYAYAVMNTNPNPSAAYPNEPNHLLLGTKWKEDPKIPFALDIYSIPNNLDNNKVIKEMKSAESIWDAATTQQLFVDIIERDSKNPNGIPFNGVNPAEVKPVSRDMMNAIGWIKMGNTGPLGKTGFWAYLQENDPGSFGTTDGWMALPTSYKQGDPIFYVQEADIALNSEVTWRTTPDWWNPGQYFFIDTTTYDIESVMLHELGHVLGLGDLYNDRNENQVMYKRVEHADSYRALGSGDKAGIQKLYPDLPVVPPTDEPPIPPTDEPPIPPTDEPPMPSSPSVWAVNMGELIQSYIDRAMSGDTITISPGIFNENLVIDKSLTLKGTGSSESGTVVDGNNAGSVFTIGGIDPNINVYLHDMLIREGSSTYGGGINNFGTLNVEDCTISGNTASVGGGVNNGGTFKMVSGTISENTARNSAGGINNNGEAEITDSTISNNIGGMASGGIGNSGTMTIEGAAINNNLVTVPNDWTTAGGGGIGNSGDLTVIESTISGNIAQGGLGGGIINDGAVTVKDSTISGNTARVGGGIWNQQYHTTNVINSILSGNTAEGRIGGGGILNRGILFVNGTSQIVNNKALYGEGGGIFSLLGSVTLDGTGVAIKYNKAWYPAEESSWDRGYGVYYYAGAPITTGGFDPTAQVTENTRI